MKGGINVKPPTEQCAFTPAEDDSGKPIVFSFTYVSRGKHLELFRVISPLKPIPDVLKANKELKPFEHIASPKEEP